MDGNGRWAINKNMPRFYGHKEGVEAAKKAIACCLDSKISYLSLYAFSKENWLRPKKEVDYIMKLLSKALINEKEFLKNNDICLKIIGDLSNISSSIKKSLNEVTEATKNNKSLILIIAFDYSGRWEILRATKNIIKECTQDKLNIKDINEAIFKKYLQTSDIPDPDILIRTGGENRLSNFLLWQLSYTEIFFLDIMWPDFNAEIFNDVIKEFNNKERRFGKISEQLKKNI